MSLDRKRSIFEVIERLKEVDGRKEVFLIEDMQSSLDLKALKLIVNTRKTMTVNEAIRMISSAIGHTIHYPEGHQDHGMILTTNEWTNASLHASNVISGEITIDEWLAMAHEENSELKVFKYVLKFHDLQKVIVPLHSKFLSVGEQGSSLILWALVDPNQTCTEEREIRIAGTGHPISRNEAGRFIGTVQSSTGLVFHIFETQ